MEIFEDLMLILEDREWHAIGEIAENLSLSVETMGGIIEKLEEANVVKSTDHLKKTSLVKGSSFIDNFLDLPTEKD